MSRPAVLLLSALLLLLSVVFQQSSLVAADGKAVFDGNCKSCHGSDGRGSEKIAKMMNIDPAKLDLLKDETTKKSDAELAKIIHDGVGKMRPFKDKLNNEEISSVVKYIRSLKK